MIPRWITATIAVGYVLLGMGIPLIAAQASGYGAARLAADAAGVLAHLAGGGRWLP